MIRPADILFYGGGECFRKFGVLSLGLTASQRVAPSLVRSGSVGPLIAQTGSLRHASANRPRISWEDDDEDGDFEVPTLLLEAPAFVNLVSSDNFDSGWTSSGTPVITASISDPAGGTGAYRIADDDGAATEYKLLNVTFTGNGVKTVVFVVREATMPASGNQSLYLYDATAAATRAVLNISAWTSGAPTVAAATGTYLGKRYVGNGYWALYALSTSVTAANTNRFELYPATTTAQTGSIDVYRVNAYNAASPPLSILNASATKPVESFTAPWVHKPRQAMSGHMRFREGEVPTWGDSSRLLSLSDAADSGARFIVRRVSGTDSYEVRHINHLGGQVASSIDVNPSWGDLIDLFWWFYAAGSVNIAARKKSPGGSWGTITTGTPSAALTPAADWSDDVMHFGSIGGSGPGSQAYHRVLIARGTGHSTGDLRNSLVFQAAA